MPIDDERRRFGEAKTVPDTKPQTAVCTADEPRPKDGVRESLQQLQEMLLLQRGEQIGFREEEEKRIKAHQLAAQHARNERNEKYERLREAFERTNRWKDEEKAEAAGEESKRAQGKRRLSYLSRDVTDGRNRQRWVSPSGRSVGEIPSTTRRCESPPRK